MAKREAKRRGPRGSGAKPAAHRGVRRAGPRSAGGANGAPRRSRTAPLARRAPLRPEAFREHLFRLDRMLDDLASRAGVVLDRPDRVERVEGLVEGALETWAELARQAEQALARAPSLGSLAESLGGDPVVRARAAALLRQAGRSWLQPRAHRIERVPRRGPVVIAVRRIGEASGWDALALRLLLEEEPTRRSEAGLLVDPELVASPVLSLALERTGGGAIDRAAAAARLDEGGTVVAFLHGRSPRDGGTRGRRVDERMIVRLALATRAAVVPVAVSVGAGGGLLGRLSPMARGGRLELAFGAPMPRGPRRSAAPPAADPGLIARRSRELRDLLDHLAQAPAPPPP